MEAAPDTATVPVSAGEPRKPPRRLVPWLVVGLVCLANLVLLRTELVAAAPANASGRNMAMVRVATDEWAAGRVPLDPWLPRQNTGAAMFHQSESAPAQATGLLGAALGADTAYRTLLYLLLALWPLAVYLAARVAALDRRVALAAAVLAPLLVSASGAGYELGAYVWAGRGWFTQLWGMWALPFAWATTWRAVHGKLNPAWAVAASAATLALHLATWPFLLLGAAVAAAAAGRDGLARRADRAVVVVSGTLVAASAVLVPLLGWLAWSNSSAYLRRVAEVEAVGFWSTWWNLLSGEVYDAGRVPVVTAVVAVGVVVCGRHARRSASARAALGLWLGAVLLHATWTWWQPWSGSLAGGTGSTAPQTLVGVHLSGLLLAAVGAAALFGIGARVLAKHVAGAAPAALAAVLAVAAVVALAPAWVERVAYALAAGRLVEAQRVADRNQGAGVAELLAVARARGPGRVYAGGLVPKRPDVRIGRVPLPAWSVYGGADVVGDVLQTSGLAADPEAQLDPADSGQLALFGVRYVLDAGDRPPPFPVVPLASRPGLTLWEMTQEAGYTRVVDGAGPALVMGRSDVAAVTRGALDEGRSLTQLRTISFAGDPPGPDTISGQTVAAGGPGRVVSSEPAPAGGTFAVDVDMRRRGYVVLAASAHGRWHVNVDGVDVHTDVLAPAFPAVALDPGRHSVTFRYEPLAAWRAWLLLLGAVAVAAIAMAFRRWGRRPVDRASDEVVEGPHHRVGLPREV